MNAPTHSLNSKVRVNARDALDALAAYFREVGDLWEGPDGCSTYGTGLCEKIASALHVLAVEPMALGLTNISPFPGAALVVPPEVLAAVDRMCKPISDTRLEPSLRASSATGREDARCMAVIRDYLVGTPTPSVGGEVAQPVAQKTQIGWGVYHANGDLYEEFFLAHKQDAHDLCMTSQGEYVAPLYASPPRPGVPALPLAPAAEAIWREHCEALQALADQHLDQLQAAVRAAPEGWQAEHMRLVDHLISTWADLPVHERARYTPEDRREARAAVEAHTMQAAVPPEGRQPLSEAQMHDLWVKHTDGGHFDRFKLIRAIEAAHGIAASPLPPQEKT